MENQITIEDLYNKSASIEAIVEGYTLPFSVELIYNASKYIGPLEPDCKIGSWEANSWFRTSKGAYGVDRYKSVGSLKRGIILSAKNRGFEVKGFNITRL